MKVLIRVDASTVIGSGHVMRCLTLAKALRARNAQVLFACRELSGHLLERISADFAVVRLPARYPGEESGLTPEASVPAEADFAAVQAAVGVRHFDWCVLDHYGLGGDWERQVCCLASRLLVIDDLQQREHECDLLLDQNLFAITPEVYPGPIVQRLFGPHYSLLREEFQAYRRLPRTPPGEFPRLLLFFGCGATAAELLKVLPALLPLPVQLDVVLGSSSPLRAVIEQLLSAHAHACLHVDTPQMAALLHAADLYVGAGGTVTWERACVGLPGVVVAMSHNQVAMSRACGEWGMQDYLGVSDKVQAADWQRAVLQLLAQPARLAQMRQRAAQLVDGLGVARVVAVMESQG